MQKKKIWIRRNDLKIAPVSMKKIYCVPQERLRMEQLRFLLPALVYPSASRGHLAVSEFLGSQNGENRR